MTTVRVRVCTSVFACVCVCERSAVAHGDSFRRIFFQLHAELLVNSNEQARRVITAQVADCDSRRCCRRRQATLAPAPPFFVPPSLVLLVSLVSAQRFLRRADAASLLSLAVRAAIDSAGANGRR